MCFVTKTTSNISNTFNTPLTITIHKDHIYDVAVAGGGLAGLSAAIELAKSGLRVALFEKKSYPRHKVCGEYVSNEVRPILARWDLIPEKLGAHAITKLTLSAPSGRTVESDLPLGAFSLSRYRFDEALALKTQAYGAVFHTQSEVTEVTYRDDNFTLVASGQLYSAKYVIGAFGKTSRLDKYTQSSHGKTGYVGIKRHVRLDFPNHLVALHCFRGGYCGVSKVEEGRVNICYLARANDLKNAGGIEAYENTVLGKNPHLKEILGAAESLFDVPLTISNFSFGKRGEVENHIFMAGDSAGMISPLSGNGMAMAITSGYILAGLIEAAVRNQTPRHVLEQQYRDAWSRRFNQRVTWGNALQDLFNRPVATNFGISFLSLWPKLTPYIIQKTHGKSVVA